MEMNTVAHSQVLRASLATVLALGLVLAGGLAVGGFAQPDAPSEETGGEVQIDEQLSGQTGTVTAVVRLTEPEAVTTDSPDEVSSSLQEHADRTQADIEQFADRRAGVTVENRFWITNAVVVTVDTERVPLSTLARVANVEAIHANFEVETTSHSLDTGLQGASPATGVGSSDVDTTYGLAQINASEAWSEHDTQGEGVRVAVIDTGVDADHDDIDLYTEDEDDETYPGGWAEFDAFGDRVEGSTPHDDDGHGTHVSGTVAGGDASGTHIGVAPEVELMHGMGLPEGSGSFNQITGAIEWAVQNDADVVSMSFGVSGYYSRFTDPIRNAENAGVVASASVGNNGEGDYSTPGNEYDTLSAGATDSDLDTPAYSGGGLIDTEDAWGNDAPDDWPDEYIVPSVVAPGVSVESAEPGGGYRAASGTSMAAPHVAGAVALVQSATDERQSSEQIKEALEATAWKPDDWDESEAAHSMDTESGTTDTRYGHGIVDIPAAIDYLQDDGGAEFTVGILDADDPVEGESLSVTTEIENVGDETDNQMIALDAGDLGTSNATVELDAGELVNETLSVDTAAGDAGPYTATVASDDDVDSTNVTVLEPATLDVDVLDVTEPTEGDALDVDVEIENSGDVEDTQTVDLDVPDLGSDETDVTLAGNESTEETLSVGTEAGDAGEYTATVESDGDSDSAEVDVLEPANYAVEILDASDPVAGETLDVGVEIENTGDVEDTQTVDLDAGTLGGDQTDVTLDGGETAEETLTVDTEAGDASTYTATVASNDDSDETDVTVLEPANFAVELLEAGETVAGESVDIEFDIENTGDVEATQTVALDIESLGDTATDVTLAGGDSTVETLSVDTEAGDAGEYAATVSSADDEDSKQVTVLEPASYAVEILGAGEPVAGEDITVEFEVENTGGVEDTGTVELTTDPAVGTNSTDVTLAGGESTEETLSVGTASGDAGEYTVTVESDDDSDATDVIVLAPADVAVELVETTEPVEAGNSLSVTATVENTGDIEDTQTVTLDAGAIGTDSTDVTLAGGESTEETLTVDTESGDAGEYTATVETADDADSTSVTVLDPASFDIDILEMTNPVAGEDIEVEFEAENSGEVEETQTIELSTSPDIGTATTEVTLAGGESTEETLTVDTESGDAGEYTATVASEDDTDSTGVDVLEPATLEMAILNATDPVAGDTLDVDVEIENTGGVKDTQTVALDVPELGSDEVDVTLAGDESTEETLSVDTDTGDAGEYTATVTSADDTASTDVTVLAGATFTVDITDTNAPVEESDELSVTVDIENVGDETGTETVTLDAGDLGTDSATVHLDAGEVDEEVLSVDTTAGDAGEYTATVETDDDDDSTTVTVLESAVFEIEILDASDAVAGDALNVDIEVENAGGVEDTQTIDLDVPDLGSDETDVTLAGGESTEETLTVATEQSDADEYTATVATDGDSDSTGVDVLEPATFAVDIVDTTTPVEGESLSVDVDVENTGDVEDTQTIDLDVPDLGSDEIDVTLAGGETTEETLTVDTAAGDAGTYTATAESEDDSDETTIDVLQQGSFAVEIVEADDPVEGEDITVTVEVENSGEVEDTGTVELTTDPDIGTDSTEVTLAGGESTEETFSVDTEAGDAGAYTATVESDDGSDSADVDVLAPANVDVEIVDATQPVEGDALDIEVEIENTGDVEDTQTVELDVPDLGSDEIDVTLAGGESAEETLSVGTEAGDAGAYTATVTSADDTDETTVDVLAPANFAIEITDANQPVEGEEIEVQFEVENTGDVEETDTVTLTTDPDIGTNSTDVTLAGSEATDETLSVATEAGDAGEYTATVETNDDDSETVTVLAQAEFAVDIVETNAPVEEGDSLTVTAAIENVGDETETQSVTLDAGDLGTDSADVTLAGDESTEETLTVDASAGDAGAYTATVETDDDDDSTSVTVLEPASFEVAILDASDGVAGDDIEVEFEVENTGDVEATQTVELDVESLGSDQTDVTLDGGESTEESLSVDTTAGDAGEYTATVASDDDTASTDVTVLESAAFDVEILDAGEPVEGEELDVEVEVENTGNVEDIGTVELDVESLGDSEADVTLAGGESTEETFSVDTESGDAGEYTATVASDDDTDETTVDVLESASVAVSILSTTDPVEGDALDVTAEIENTGDVAGTETVTLDVGALGTDSTTVELDEGELVEETLTVDTESGDAGEYTATVETNDDSDSASVTVQADASFVVEALDTTAPVPAGEALVVETSVTNTGQTTETETVELLVGGSSVDNASVQLEAGETWTGEFAYETHPSDQPEVDIAVVTDEDAVASTAQVHRPVPPYAVGDVNEDGERTIQDVLVIRQYLVGMDVEINENLADINRDGQVGLSDMFLLSQYLNGFVDGAFAAVSEFETPDEVEQGDEVSVAAELENTGGLGTIQAAEFRLAGSEAALTENATESVEVVDLGPGETVDADATIPTDDLSTGEYVLGVVTDDTTETVTIDVTAPEPDGEPPERSPGGSVDPGPGLAAVAS